MGVHLESLVSHLVFIGSFQMTRNRFAAYWTSVTYSEKSPRFQLLIQWR